MDLWSTVVTRKSLVGRRLGKVKVRTGSLYGGYPTKLAYSSQL